MVTTETTVFVARRVITMDPQRPSAEAVAVTGGRIVAVGSLDDVRSTLAEGEYTVDSRFADAVFIAGLIDQHLHPVLGASTLTTEVIAPEDWVLPTRTHLAANSPSEYDDRLRTRTPGLAKASGCSPGDITSCGTAR